MQTSLVAPETTTERKAPFMFPGSKYWLERDISGNLHTMTRAISGGTAAPPRERFIGRIEFRENTFGPDLLSPNGFPMLNYEWLILRLSGTLTIGVDDATAVRTEAPFSLVKSVQVVVTGLSGDTFIEIGLSELRVLTHFIGRRPGQEPQFTNPGLTQAAHPFDAEVYLPFAIEDMSNPYRGFFAANRYSQVKVRIQWGEANDLVAPDATTTLALSNTWVDVWGREYSFDPRFELAQNLLLHQRNFLKDITIDNQAQTNFDIEIPRTASFLRGLLLKQFTLPAADNGAEVPVNTLVTGDDQVTLIYNDTDRKFEYRWDQLTRQNYEMYRGNLPEVSSLPFYAFIDLSPRGDFSLLQNLSNLQKIQVRIDNAAVADARLRVIAVKYAISN